MKIVKERTRLLFTEFTDEEKRHVEDLVASMDNVFMYYDEDNHVIGLPTGMENTIKKIFRNAKFVDNSQAYWDFARIEPVEHNAKPRNQLQIDFINFVLQNAKKKQKLAGVLSPGTGKSIPMSTKLPTPSGWKMMKDIQEGDLVFSDDGLPTVVDGVFPQGILDVYKITFNDGRTARCSLDHLWKVQIVQSYSEYDINNSKWEILPLKEIIEIKLHNMCSDIYIPTHNGIVDISSEGITHNEKSHYIRISSIVYEGKEECQCIHVNSSSHLFLTENFIVTHNTFMACYSAIAVGLRTLIIVPTYGIKVQWAETLTNMFGIPPERVKMISNPKDFINVKADFVVVSHASLATLNKSFDLEKIMKDAKFGIKVIDEVQMWFKNIINVDACSNIANNWYITGTFGRSGATENKLYHEMFGDLAIFEEKMKKPTIFNPKPGNVYGMKPHMHVKMIWTKSRLSPEEIKKVTSSMRYSEREGKWMRFGVSVPAYSELVFPSDGTMTKFMRTCLEVIQIAEQEVRYGRTLVLLSTINSTEILADYIRKIYPNKTVRTFHSRNSKSENDANKAEADILVSTISSAGTGFDMKDLSKLVTAAQWSSWILSDQISGRLRRRPDGKETFMWDIVDAQIPQLRAWANNRADVYKRKAKTFKVIDM